MRKPIKRSVRMLAASTAVTMLVSLTQSAAAQSLANAPDGGDAARTHRTLMTYARDTWRSFDAMVDPTSGLPADNVAGDLAPDSRSAYTSPTNIGAYMWSTIVARDVGVISRAEAILRIARTLVALRRLERHEATGMYYNWYNPTTGAKLREWPTNGDPIYPFLSSVDNGWLATSLMTVRTAEPALRFLAEDVLRTMDFGSYYDPHGRGPEVKAGLIRGGFWDEEPPGCSTPGNYHGRGEDVWYTCHHYGAFNTEPRIASYVGIARGQIPREHYFAGWRTFPDTCDWGWQEQKPVGEWGEYLGVPVFEGAYRYRDIQVVPTWGGSMFEALMVPLFVPEETWGPNSWGRNHPAFVRAQIEHGMNDAEYGYWGFSPSNNPDGTPAYREYGVDAIGLDGPGYTSDQQRTSVDPGFADCRPAQPVPTEYGEGVVTPHAPFLALRYAPRESLENLANLRRDFDSYGPGGFYDAVNVTTGTVSKAYLALDQGMILAALGNALRHDSLRNDFVRGEVRRTIQPLLGIEEFNVPAQQ